MNQGCLLMTTKGLETMNKRTYATLDGNEAVAHVAYRLNEVIVIYPITPSSPMGEWADAWSSEGKPNIWGTLPSVVELQSKGALLVLFMERCRLGR